MDLCTYYVCDLVSGQVLDTLPLTGAVSNILGDIGSQSWSLPVKDQRVPANWLSMLQPVKTMMVCEWRGELVQGWVITGLKVGEADAEIQAATLERLTEKVYCRTDEWYYTDEAQIAAELVQQVLAPQGNWTVEYTATGTKTDMYQDEEAAVSLKSALDTLSATDTGPRWRCEVCWEPGQEGNVVEKKFLIAHSFGQVRPDVVFTGQMIDSYSRTLDWTSDYGALRLWGTTEGTTGTGVSSQSYASSRLSQGWHPWEGWVA